MKYLLGLAVLSCIAALYVAFKPATSSATRTAVFNASIEEVWSVYTDFPSQPDWRDDLTAIEFKNK